MLRPRFYDFRSSLGPTTVGLCATDIQSLLAYANESEQRLIEDPLSPEDGWYGSEVRIAFNVTQANPFIIPPQNVARIMGMAVCKRAINIVNRFYEYLEFGPGLQPKGCTNANGSAANPSCQSPLMAYERETVTTFAPMLATPQYIRAYLTDPADVGRTALIQGKDQNGQVVRFIDPLAGVSGVGETITLDQPFTDTTNQFLGELIGVQKQKTFGEVQFFQVDAASGQESSLLVMDPSETTASFRKYFVNGLPNCCGNVPGGTIQVEALCKLDFVPITCDSDYLNLQSVPALIDACQWIRMSRMDVPGAQQLAEAKHASALKLLYGKLQHYMGNVNPSIQRHVFGSDRLCRQPV